MSETSLTPGKSLESDLQLIREARGISREEVFSRVHIRPEVLAQVEENGFGATPTLNSDIHRRSFVKHYADAVEIDAEVALAALQKSLTGLYDGSLAVEYLGLKELTSMPRWAQQSEDTPTDTAEQADERDQPEQHAQADVGEQKDTKSEFDVVPSEPEPSLLEVASESEIPEVVAPTRASLPDPEIPDVTETEETPVVPVSPYAPPRAGSAEAAPSKAAPTKAPPTKVPSPGTPQPNPPLPQAPREAHGAGPALKQGEGNGIPSSTMKQSVIGPPDEDDFGDVEPPWLRLRGQHWLTWLGLAGVAVVLLFVIGQAIFGEKKDDAEAKGGITTAADLPDQFTGIVRLTPTTERFVNLQIFPDSLSPTEFAYKIWTDSEGSIFAETGKGRLNPAENQILLAEPYGVGGLFLLEGGAVGIRSVRRIRFPRWEFTGQNE